MARLKPWICTKCGVLMIPPLAHRNASGELVSTCTISHTLGVMCGGTVREVGDGEIGRVSPVELD